MNNSFNKRCAFSFILQEQLYTVLLSILYCALEGDVPKPIILFVALSAFQILTLRIAQTSTRGQYVLSADHQVFSKRQIIFRLQVKGWRSWRRPGNRCPRHEPIPPQLIRFTHVRVKVILIYVRRSRHCDESPLHTALCAGEEADGYLASATRIYGIRLSIHLYDYTLRKVFYCLLNTFTAVCHPAGVTSWSHIIRGCDRTHAQIMCTESPTVVL